jgi:hypothetical protein
MSRQPSYPKDATVGEGASEAMAAAGAAKAAAPAGRARHLAAGAAIGIGSAAIVAALLYAKKRKGDR